MGILTLLLAMGCPSSAPEAGPPPPAAATPPGPTQPPADTSSTAKPPGEVGPCAPTPHPLVFDCTFDLPEAAPLTLRLTSSQATDRTFDSAAATHHAIRAWGLQADTAYEWSTGDASGSFTTGSLPPGLDELSVSLRGDGALFGADAVLVYVSCGFFVMLETDGDVIWFTRTLYDSFSDGMMWSPADRTVLALADSVMSFTPSAFEERDLLGDVILSLDPDTHFDLKLTHDVGRWGRYTYLLGEAGFGMGGFEVFDGTTKLGQWLIDDSFPGFGWSHVNGLTVSDAGEVIVSEHIHDTIFAVDGDPASPTFLGELWHASGSATAEVPDPDYRPETGVLFEGQHRGSRHGDELWVFDNRSQGQARALRMSMHHTTGRLEELDSWSMAGDCPNQGGAVPLPGGVLATCANSGWVTAFRDGETSAEWAVRAQCGTTGFARSTRGFPVVVE